MNRYLLVLSALLCLVSCKSGIPVFRHTASQAPDPVKVKVQTVRMEPSEERHSFVGEVVSSRSALISAPHPGKLVSLEVKKGDVVKAGQVLARISSSTVESAYKIASANLEQARDGYDRATQVYAEGNVSEIQYMDIKTKLQQAEAAMESARKAKDDCTVKAPYSGVVSATFADEGVDLAPGHSLVSIMDMSGLEIRISVHENEIARIREGAGASIDIPAFGIENLPARVSAKSFLASALAHCYDCNLKLESIPSGLLPGMSVRVMFDEDGEDCLTVPAEAVQVDAGGRYLWLCEDGVVRKVHIEVGGYSGKGIVVSSGLSEGDKVIVSGYHKVSEGMKVIAE